MDDHRLMADLTDEAFYWRVDDPSRASLNKRAYKRIEQLDEHVEALTAERDDLQEREKRLRYYIKGIERVWKEAELELDDSKGIVSGLKVDNARLREALTPSEETKLAYSTEFFYEVRYTDDMGVPLNVWRPVSWETIQQIMAAILARADDREHDDE